MSIYGLNVPGRPASIRNDAEPQAAIAVVGHIMPAVRAGGMTTPHALAALAALGQPSRLDIFRALVRREPDGIPAGQIAQAVGSRHNTTSSNLAILARAGLIHGTRDGRSIIYRADLEGIRALINFLLTDCCGGHPEVCRPLSNLIETITGDESRRTPAGGQCNEGC